MNIKLNLAIGVFSVLALGGLSNKAFADTTYTSTNFPDEAFFDCVKVAAGVNASATSITKTQAESINNLSCASSAYQFSDATGIELLTGLTKLTIENQNDLKTLDLSKNTKLSDLINISGNPKLETLKFGQASGIETLFAEHNALKNLDISGLTGVTRLSVTDNSLSSLDISKNAALTSLTASKNQLSGIDLSSNTSLLSAYLYDNQFEYIDVSKINKNLLDLYLDDDVLVRTNFVAVQTSKGGNYYASPSTNGGTNGMFISMIVATGLSSTTDEKTEITTPGAAFHRLDNQCDPNDAFCIIIDSDILNYQNYVQLKYVGQPASESEIARGIDRSKRNYRLEINLNAYTSETPSPSSKPSAKTPNTGIFSNEENGATTIITSLVSVVTIALISYASFYGIKRHHNRAKFTNSKF